MNISGAFTFGTLIKTFLPGFVWLITIGVIEADLAKLLGRQAALLTAAQSQPEVALLLAVPASILFGLLSNVVCFMGLNDRLVRKPFEREHPRLFKLCRLLCQRVQDDRWDKLNLNDVRWDNLSPNKEELKRSYDDCADAEVYMLQEFGVTNIVYFREQYWFHMEFQMNLFLSLAALYVSILMLIALSDALAASKLANIVIASVLVPLCIFLVRAAKKNYTRHISKKISLLVALLQPKEGPKEA